MDTCKHGASVVKEETECKRLSAQKEEKKKGRAEKQETLMFGKRSGTTTKRRPHTTVQTRFVEELLCS